MAKNDRAGTSKKVAKAPKMQASKTKAPVLPEETRPDGVNHPFNHEMH